MNGNKPVHLERCYCMDQRPTPLRATISRRSIVPALSSHSPLCLEITGTIAHPGYGRSTCPYFRAGALVPRPGSKGMLNRHIPEVGSFEWLCAYRGMCEDAQDCQVQEDGDPQGGSHLSTTQRAGISRRSGFPALPAHSSLCTEIPGKPAHSGYTRLTCPYFRAEALA